MKEKTKNIELELDGAIYIVEKDEGGNILTRDEIDGEVCLKVLVRVLDDALRNPYLAKTLGVEETIPMPQE